VAILFSVGFLLLFFSFVYYIWDYQLGGRERLKNSWRERETDRETGKQLGRERWRERDRDHYREIDR